MHIGENIYKALLYNVLLYAYLAVLLQKQFMEVIKIENFGHYRDDMIIPGDIFLLQVSSLSPC